MPQGHLQYVVGQDPDSKVWGFAVSGKTVDIDRAGERTKAEAEHDAKRMILMLSYLAVKWNLDALSKFSDRQKAEFRLIKSDIRSGRI